MRLIDADKLKEVFDKNVVSAEIWNDIIDNQPTAYDMEKVVEKLEELKHPYTTFPESDGCLKAFDYYIEKSKEFVKGGGIDE